MAIFKAPSPDAVTAIAAQYVARALPAIHEGANTFSMKGGAVSPVELSMPYAIYSADVNSILEHRLLASARQTGWQYLVRRGVDALLTADIRIAEGVIAPSKIMHPDGLVPLFSAIDRATESAPADVDMELRLLRVPAALFNAVWLHGDQGDLLVPIAPALGKLSPDQVFSEEEVVEALRPIAARRAELADAEG